MAAIKKNTIEAIMEMIKLTSMDSIKKNTVETTMEMEMIHFILLLTNVDDLTSAIPLTNVDDLTSAIRHTNVDDLTSVTVEITETGALEAARAPDRAFERLCRTGRPASCKKLQMAVHI